MFDLFVVLADGSVSPSPREMRFGKFRKDPAQNRSHGGIKLTLKPSGGGTGL